MKASEVVLGVIVILVSAILILLVAAQEAKQSNLSAIQGGGSSDFKGRGKSKDLLKKATKIFSAVFFVLVLAGAIFTNVSK